MDLTYLTAVLEAKDNAEAYKNFQKLEALSEESDLLYPYLNIFADLVQSEKYVRRVRGFRLFCKQARWDSQNLIEQRIAEILTILHDKKPTAVRQALSALQEIVHYKKGLRTYLREQVLALDYLRYQESMQGLIAKDIQSLLQSIEKAK